MTSFFNIFLRAASLGVALGLLACASSDFDNETLTPPALEPLVVLSSGEHFIELAPAEFIGRIANTEAYIGRKFEIELSGDEILDYVSGPANITKVGHVFAELAAGETYEIIVIARNAAGFRVQRVTETTSNP